MLTVTQKWATAKMFNIILEPAPCSMNVFLDFFKANNQEKLKIILFFL